MLTIRDPRPDRNCSGFRRREFLKIGALGLGGLGLGGFTLPNLLATRALAGSAGEGNYLRDRAVVVLFLQGGPSHIEFFDPKMTAPAEVRSLTGEIATRTPGVTLGGTFERLAAMTDKFSLVRNYGSQNASHTYLEVMSAGNPLKAAMGAVYARLAGSTHPVTGLPTNMLVLPEAVQDGLKLEGNFETGALPTLTSPGDLGVTCEAFSPAGGGQLRKDMQLAIPAERLDSRRELLTQLDATRRRVESSREFQAADRYQQLAFEVVSRGVAQAFDLSKEDPSVAAQYETSHLFDMRDLTRYYDMRRATNLLGRQMLLARRLVEAGCGFITVSDCGWDMHANNNSPKGMAGIWPMSRQVDHAVAAFLNDIEQRGLSDKVLLVVTGEMGRTPRINNGGGRDHYGSLTPLLLAGGGIQPGQVVGQSDRFASKPVDAGYTPRNLMGTVMHTLFDMGRVRLDPSAPSELLRFLEGCEPIAPLMA